MSEGRRRALKVQAALFHRGGHQDRVASGSCHVGSGPCENEGEAAPPSEEEAKIHRACLPMRVDRGFIKGALVPVRDLCSPE